MMDVLRTDSRCSDGGEVEADADKGAEGGLSVTEEEREGSAVDAHVKESHRMYGIQKTSKYKVK